MSAKSVPKGSTALPHSLFVSVPAIMAEKGEAKPAAQIYDKKGNYSGQSSEELSQKSYGH